MMISGDLHIHTALSPCGADEMTPINIVNMAELLEAKVLAITDHNSSENIESVIRAAVGKNLLIIPGMEVTTKEEVHILCLFKNVYDIKEFQRVVDEKLPDTANRPEVFGHQYIMDWQGRVLKEKKPLLLNAVQLTVEETVGLTKKLRGICIPSHIDRPHYSLLNNLGFIPEDVEFAAFEVSHHIDVNSFISKHKELGHYSIIQSTDAHCLKDMLHMKTRFVVKELTCEEIFMAIKNQEGRRVVIN